MSTRYCGRNFSRDDLDRIKQLIDEDKTRTRAELSRLTCQQLNWFKADVVASKTCLAVWQCYAWRLMA
jgi:hypothetical protein